MVGEIADFIGGVKGALDLVKGLLEIRDARLRADHVAEINKQLYAALEAGVAAKAEQATLIDQKRALEEKIRGFETWHSEKDRYRLAQLPGGGFALAVKEEARGAEPKHHICADCAEQRVKSLLHAESWIPKAEVLTCHRCGGTLYLVGKPSPDHRTYRQSSKP